MGIETIILITTLVVGFYVAWNIGANDVANAMGTSVGSGALTLRRAVILAAILEFSGAFFLGSHVAETVESGVVNPEAFADAPRLFIYGMLASLLAAGVWLQVASYFGWPVSTTHSIIGALIGFGWMAAGIDSIKWDNVGFILTSWIISPIMGGTLGFLIFNLIRRKIFYSSNPILAAKKLTPYLVFTVFAILSLVLFFGGVSSKYVDLPFWGALGFAVVIGGIAALISAGVVRRLPVPEANPRVEALHVTGNLERALKHLKRAVGSTTGELKDRLSVLMKQALSLSEEVSEHKQRYYESLETEHRTVEKIFVGLQIISACLMAFAHGANDVANAIGPLAAVIDYLKYGILLGKSDIPTWLLGLGGVGIVIGLATWGWRVIRTVGKRITELTPTRGFSAEFGAAVTIVIASRLGLPISTTHTLVGAVLGVGLARGIGAINLNVVRDIVISWVITIPVGAILSILFYRSLLWIFG